MAEYRLNQGSGVVVSDDAPLPVSGKVVVPSSNFNRPADTTQYAVGDLVANSTTAGSVTPLSFDMGRVCDGFVRRVRMWSSDNDTTSASFRLHLFTASPTVSAGDNSAIAIATVTNADYLGAVDITLDRAIVNSDAFGVGVPRTGQEMNFAGYQTLYGLLEARATYTPASGETLTLVVETHIY